MNIIEALKSGKRFRRKGMSFWYSNENLMVSTDHILDDEWEIEEEKVEVTRDRLVSVILDNVTVEYGTASFINWNAIFKTLGFKNDK